MEWSTCQWCGIPVLAGHQLCDPCEQNPEARKILDSYEAKPEPIADPDTFSITTVAAKDPIRAYKAATIVVMEKVSESDFIESARNGEVPKKFVQTRTASFRPAAHGGVLYSADEEAICTQRGNTHDYDNTRIPALSCTCGFYAWKDISKVDEYTNAAKLEVDLLGKVIDCSQGYRAAHQRVMRVDFAHTCCICKNPATTLGLDGTYAVDVFCTPCSQNTMHCVETITTDELSSLLNTEVMWQPSDSKQIKFYKSYKFKSLAPLWIAFITLFALYNTGVITDLEMFLACSFSSILHVPFAAWINKTANPNGYFKIPDPKK